MEATNELGATQLLDRIALLEARAEHWQHVAETDSLTELPNRRQLERRTDARDGWFVMCDLAGFKNAQDTHPDGHSYGDRILQEFADFLEGSTRTGRGRSEDRVAARTGGDEFIVWCPSRHGARRIKQLVRAWVSGDGRVAARAGMGKDIASADAAMYISRELPRGVILR
tara:strand:- start:12583 stop:13092 length:510 start_codon:yes stop_codon:yes gene_type:complete